MLQMGELQWRQRLRLAEAALAVASVTRGTAHGGYAIALGFGLISNHIHLAA